MGVGPQPSDIAPHPDRSKALGVDVARGGKDQTVLIKRYGNWFEPPIIHPGKDTPDGKYVADLVMRELEEGTHVFIDVVGVGSSPYDTLKENKVKVTGVNAASTSKQTDRSKQFGFANMRAELYWKMREALEPGKGDDLALPDNRQLLADLCAPRYSVTARGIMIEGKEDIRRRLGRSPDCGDAAVLALSQRVVKQYVRFL